MTPDHLPLFQDVPRALVLVRHGESLGNVADREARDAGAERLDLDVRDADVDLSENGQQQAKALGSWFAELAEEFDGAAVGTAAPDAAGLAASLIALVRDREPLVRAGERALAYARERQPDRHAEALRDVIADAAPRG